MPHSSTTLRQHTWGQMDSGQEGHEALADQRCTTDGSRLAWYWYSSQEHLGVPLMDGFVCTWSCSECPMLILRSFSVWET